MTIPSGFQVIVAPTNGKPQRLVEVTHTEHGLYRDKVDTNSSQGRNRLVRGAAAKFNLRPAKLGWLGDAIVAKADEADRDADAAVVAIGLEPKDVGGNQATRIIEMASGVELFHDPSGNGFGRYPVGSHLEVSRLNTKQYRRWLTHLYWKTTGSSPATQSLQEAIALMESKAAFEGEERPVGLRVAGLDGKIYVDLCNPEWQVVEIDRDGWRVLDESPVMFKRAQAMLPLPVPVSGGSIEEQRRFLNVSDDDWTLIKGWEVMAFRPPTVPYPVLVVVGEQGGGKTFASSCIRSTIDPNTAPLRADFREPRDLMICAGNGHVIAVDNVSSIPQRMSDTFCRISTGGGFSTRALFENDEEVIFSALRPQLFNGIDDFITSSDLLDRSIVVNLPRMEPGQRIPESQLAAEFEEAKPRILGALFSAVATAIRNEQSVNISGSDRPRMLDFAIWGEAAGPAIGLLPGEFIEAYNANRASVNSIAIESSPVGKAVLSLAARDGFWEGTPSELLLVLEASADEPTKRMKSWPESPSKLGGMVKRLAPNFRAAGVPVEFGRKGKGRARWIMLGQPSNDNEAIDDANDLFNQERQSDDDDGRGRTAEGRQADGSDGFCRPPLTCEIPTTYEGKNARRTGRTAFSPILLETPIEARKTGDSGEI